MNILARKGEQAFVSTGFANWKDPRQDFDRHQTSEMHIECANKWHHHLHGERVDTMLCSEKKKQQAENRAALEAIVSSLKFLGRQGLSFRGHIESEGNVMQLLEVRKRDNEQLSTWLSRSGRESYASHDIQDEILKLMSRAIILKIVENVQRSHYFAIIADESTDISGSQQLSISLRWVDEMFALHEDFVGLYKMDGANAKIITKIITDVLVRLCLPISNLRGQGYDGASVMAGSISGVATRIMKLEKRAVYIHCCAHSLNLALQDATRSCTVIRDTLDFVREVVNFIRASPYRSQVFDELKAESPDESSVSGLRPLCPTRWTVRSGAIRSILDNYQALADSLAEISMRNTDDTGAKANGFLKQMHNFEIYFGLEIAVFVFESSEACSKKLQTVDISVSEAVKSANEVVKLATDARTEKSFNTKYEACVKTAEKLGIDPPSLPRQIRIPKKLNDGGEQFVFADAKSRYRQIYYQFLESSAMAITSRFEQDGFKLCLKIEKALVAYLNPYVRTANQGADEAAAAEEARRTETKSDLKEICKHYDGDLDYKRLQRQLAVLQDTCKDKIKTVRDVCTALAAFPSLQEVFSEVSKLVKLFLVIPAS